MRVTRDDEVLSEDEIRVWAWLLWFVEFSDADRALVGAAFAGEPEDVGGVFVRARRMRREA